MLWAEFIFLSWSVIMAKAGVWVINGHCFCFCFNVLKLKILIYNQFRHTIFLEYLCNRLWHVLIISPALINQSLFLFFQGWYTDAALRCTYLLCRMGNEPVLRLIHLSKVGLCILNIAEVVIICIYRKNLQQQNGRRMSARCR